MEIYGSAFNKSLDENLNLARGPHMIQAQGEAWVKGSGLESSAHCKKSDMITAFD